MTTFYFIRHGKSEDNVKQLWGGDSHLTELGKEQAKEISKLHLNPDIIYTSCLIRTKETRENAFPDFDEERIFESKEFNELNFGELEDTHYDKDETKDDNRYKYNNEIENLHNYFHGDNAYERTISAIKKLKEIAKDNQEKTIVIISSDTIIRLIFSKIIRDDFSLYNTFHINNGTCYKLIYDNKEEKFICDEREIYKYKNV